MGHLQIPPKFKTSVLVQNLRFDDKSAIISMNTLDIEEFNIKNKLISCFIFNIYIKVNVVLLFKKFYSCQAP